MQASVLPPESVFVWRLDGLHADNFTVGTDVEWPSPSFLACGLKWHVRLVPDVRSGDGGRYCGAYLYLETPDCTFWPALAEIKVDGGKSVCTMRLHADTRPSAPRNRAPKAPVATGATTR